MEERTRALIRAILQEEAEQRRQQEDAALKRTLEAVLVMFGIDPHDRALSEELKELRADLRSARRWRKSVECVERVGTGTAVTVLVTGVLGALWLGIAASLQPFRSLIGK